MDTVYYFSVVSGSCRMNQDNSHVSGNVGKCEFYVIYFLLIFRGILV